MLDGSERFALPGIGCLSDPVSVRGSVRLGRVTGGPGDRGPDVGRPVPACHGPGGQRDHRRDVHRRQASTGTNNVKACNDGQEGVEFTVVASRAPDEATAKQDEADTRADLEKNAPGLPYKLEELPGFAPGADAAVVSGSMSTGGGIYSGIAIYVLKGTDFFGITDISSLGGQAPTSAQMQDLAKVALGRLP